MASSGSSASRAQILRQERLAQALRDNLMRRKAQGRLRAEEERGQAGEKNSPDPSADGLS